LQQRWWRRTGLHFLLSFEVLFAKCEVHDVISVMFRVLFVNLFPPI
jgi:hypothetical protein